MKKKIAALLRDKSGGMYVDLILGLMAIFCVTAVMVTLFPAFSLSQELEQTARTAARVAEVTGRVGVEVNDVLYHSNNMVPDTVEWDVEYYDRQEKTIQLKSKFTLILTKKVPVTIMQPVFGPPIQYMMTLKADASGVSEVYWK